MYLKHNFILETLDNLQNLKQNILRYIILFYSLTAMNPILTTKIHIDIFMHCALYVLCEFLIIIKKLRQMQTI